MRYFEDIFIDKFITMGIISLLVCHLTILSGDLKSLFVRALG